MVFVTIYKETYFLLSSPQVNIKYSKKYHIFFSVQKKYIVFFTIVETYIVFFTIFYISLRGQLFFMAISTRKYSIILL